MYKRVLGVCRVEKSNTVSFLFVVVDVVSASLCCRQE
jgi:hypothetical protein